MNLEPDTIPRAAYHFHQIQSSLHKDMSARMYAPVPGFFTAILRLRFECQTLNNVYSSSDTISNGFRVFEFGNMIFTVDKYSKLDKIRIRGGFRLNKLTHRDTTTTPGTFNEWPSTKAN